MQTRCVLVEVRRRLAANAADLPQSRSFFSSSLSAAAVLFELRSDGTDVCC